jgi:hypothetical protein
MHARARRLICFALRRWPSALRCRRAAAAPYNKELDAKTLANMSEEDFTAFVDKAKKSDLRELMGD